MPNEVIADINNRNHLAWSIDKSINMDYSKKLADLEKNKTGLSQGVYDQKKLGLLEEKKAELSKLGEERINLLNNLKIMVLGSGPLAQFVSGGLMGLGIGTIYVVGNEIVSRNDSYDFLVTKESNLGKSKVDEIVARMNEINDYNNFVPVFSRFSSALTNSFYPSDMIIDATNSSVSKNKVLRYCIDNKIPLISASSSFRNSRVSSYKPNSAPIRLKDSVNLEAVIHQELDGLSQDIVSSGIIAGIILEEVRKQKFSMSKTDFPLKNFQVVNYNPYSKTRNNKLRDLPKCAKTYANKRVLVAGAGALGNFVAMELALLGVGQLDILDMDSVEVSNLNRQINFDKSNIGKEYKKATVLFDRLKKLNPSINGTGIVAKLEMTSDNLIKEGNYDVLLGCFDNKIARQTLDHFAEKYNIPYVDGGCSTNAGQVVSFIPGYNQKVTEQVNFPDPSNSGNQVGCAIVAQANPSIITSNAIIGSATVAEALKILSGQNYGDVGGSFNYRSNSPDRIWLDPYVP
ncbi:hypothetical protein HOK51_02135 [Candidatus Woesearchaeota archaeon]|jgi:molybdopterin/thiamine biosynthesis adenylyltransferase|nr:hypothetical protein [Candidatus Woesearchaeota archaeon]MBT6518615.1 hypothetical protein [Candidatus Woesearchaeota archaeon]MBT7368745.1 hypothetical protein [Candidatus Woesearchaeota archaeon]